MHFYYLAMLIITIAAPIVKMVLRALGIGVVAYVGINALFDEAKDVVVSQIGSAAGPIQSILDYRFWGVYVVGGVILPSVLLVCVCTLLLALAATPLFVGEPTTRMCVDHNNKGITRLFT